MISNTARDARPENDPAAFALPGPFGPGLVHALSLLVLMLLWTTGAGAGPAPEQVIRQQAETLLERISGERSPDDMENLVQEIVAPHVDFTLFSKLVLGKHWRTLSAAQQARFEQGMTHLVLKTYSAALANTSGLAIDYLGVQEDRNAGRVTVATRVQTAGNPPVSVDYRLYESNGAWKVYDVAIEGVSMAINYRTVLAERISAEGIEAVIDGLSKQPGALAAR
ncbi:MAG: ABC transporter substrate-binding protein [Thiogranum sp.]|nr:ABC transporter substrate-binding protein [Thiogranum sp.]